MAKVICSKCGMTGSSKCPHQRNVFSDNQMDALLGSFMPFTYKSEAQDSWENNEDGTPKQWHKHDLVISVRWTWGSYTDDKGNEVKQSAECKEWTEDQKVEAWKYFAEQMWLMVEAQKMYNENPNAEKGRYDYPTIEQWACKHDWVHVKGEDTCGYCGQTNIERD